jgi:hypothetical protein
VSDLDVDAQVLRTTSMPPEASSFRMASKTGSRAASVFPLAVGAIRRMLSPAMMGSMAFSWGGVGSLIPRASKPSSILGWRREKALAVILRIL